MRRIILYIAVSLDGKIADKDGNVDWLYAVENKEKTDYGYSAFYSSIDTTLLGYNTYQQTLSLSHEFPYKGKENFVFTTKSDIADAEHVRFVSEDILDFVGKLKEKEGKDIWLVGGGKLIAILFEHCLIDQLQVCVMPIVVGEGVPLFNLPIRESLLQLEDVEKFSNGAVLLKYNRKK